MKRLHLMMLLVVLVFAGIFMGNMFFQRRGAWAGAALAAVLAGAMLWLIAPAECRRQLGIIERSGTTLRDPEVFRARFIKGVRLPALLLLLLGLAALVIVLLLPA